MSVSSKRLIPRGSKPYLNHCGIPTHNNCPSCTSPIPPAYLNAAACGQTSAPNPPGPGPQSQGSGVFAWNDRPGPHVGSLSAQRCHWLYHGHQAGERSKDNQWWEGGLTLTSRYKDSPGKVCEKHAQILRFPKEEKAMPSDLREARA